MLRPTLLVLGAALLVGCTTLDSRDGRWPDRVPDSRRADTRPADDVYRTSEYRRFERDATDYARRVERALRVDRRTERAIADVLARRTERVLVTTRARDHRAVYPFPRREDTRAQRDFWTAADRDIERLLDRRDRERYRDFARTDSRTDPRSARADGRPARDDGRRQGPPHGRGPRGR